MDPFEIPSDLTPLTADQLNTLVEQARERAEEIRAIPPADITDADLTELEAITGTDDTPGLFDRVKEVTAEREAAVAERQARIDAAGSRLEAPADDDEDADTDVEGTDTTEAPEAEIEVEAEQAPALAASAGRSRVARTTPAKAVRPANTKNRNSLSLVAAADLRGVAAGSEFTDLDALTDAFINRTRSFPQGSRPTANVYSKQGVATLRRNFNDGLVDTNKDYATTHDLMVAATDEKRLSGGSLVASGGWCAPSEVLYDFPADETTEGIIDLPEIGVTRGGIRYTLGPDFRTIFTNSGFRQTEAQAIAGTTKACFEVSCPDFTEVRLDAYGFCVKAPILTMSAYPEVVRRFIAGTVIANEHKIAAGLIQSMRNLLPTASTLTPVRSGATAWTGLTALELAAQGIREQRKLAANTTMEVIVPQWYKIALRADLANRSHQAADSVSDAQMMQHFADRNLSVQFVLDWQELSSAASAPINFDHVAADGGAVVTGNGSSVEALIYPAGTFVKGTQDVISLDTVYDTADLQTNVYTAAFVEDGVLLAKMKYGGFKVTLPVYSSGQMGSATLTAPYGTATSSTTA